MLGRSKLATNSAACSRRSSDLISARVRSSAVAVSAMAVYYVNAHNLTHFYLHGMIGFLVSFFVGYAVSLITPHRVPEVDTAPQG